MIGPVWEAVRYAVSVLEIEVNSVDDNPLVLLDQERIFHGGHFHGQPVAMAMDFLKVALTELGNVSERRFARFIDENLSNGLPPFLSPGEPGLDAGFEGAQYAATSLLAESRTLATPASIQSISANAGFQDVVSMGMISARQALEILQNVEYIVGLEILAAAQAADFVGVGRLGPASKSVYDLVRESVPFMAEDRAMFIDLDILRDLVASGRVVSAVEDQIGALD
jgi:histidine ammonia-lyase